MWRGWDFLYCVTNLRVKCCVHWSSQPKEKAFLKAILIIDEQERGLNKIHWIDEQCIFYRGKVVPSNAFYFKK